MGPPRLLNIRVPLDDLRFKLSSLELSLSPLYHHYDLVPGELPELCLLRVEAGVVAAVGVAAEVAEPHVETGVGEQESWQQGNIEMRNVLSSVSVQTMSNRALSKLNICWRRFAITEGGSESIRVNLVV